MQDTKLDMDWGALYFGKVHTTEVLEAVQDDYWQSVRKSMKGKSLLEKYNILLSYVCEAEKLYHNRELSSQLLKRVYIQSTNYVTALSRGGLIKPADYRQEVESRK